MTDRPSGNDLLTLDEAAAVLDLQISTVISNIDRGALPAIELDGNGPRRHRLRLRREDVTAYVTSRRTWKRKIPGWEPPWQRKVPGWDSSWQPRR